MTSHYYSSTQNSKDKRGRIETILRGKRYSFISSRGVFSSKRIDLGTRILVENMIIPETGEFLDLGCGIGVIGIVAASLNPELNVHLSDINSRAVELTQLNIKNLKLENCKIYQGDLYTPFKNQSFNTIVSNPPISAGMHKVVFPLISGAHERLIDGGMIQLIIQSKKGGKMLADFIDKIFGSHIILAKKSGYRVLFATKE
jgi:16S rRNA (guanine1207-N2)-methyltransferase